MWDKKLDLEGAMDYVDQLTRKRVQEYVDAKAQLRSFGPDLDDKVALYIRGIEYWVQGAIDWTFMTARKSRLGYSHSSQVLTIIAGYFGADAEKVRDTGMVDIMAPIAPTAPLMVEV